MNEPKNTALGSDAKWRYAGVHFTPMETFNTTSLPEAVAGYFAAANRFDASAAAACFTADARVRDERAEHAGFPAIQAWVAQTSAQYRPRATVLRAMQNGLNLELTVQVVGQFPGSPIELEYELRLQGGKIAQLTIR